MDKKRLLYIILFLLVCVGLGYLMYRVFFAKPPTEISVTVPPITAPGEFPAAGEGAIIPGITAPPAVLPAAPAVPVSVPSVPTAPAEPYTPSQVVSASVLAPKPDKIEQAKFYNQTDGKFYRLKNDGSIEALSDEVFYSVQNVTWSPVGNESIIEYPDGANIYYNFDTKKQVTLPKHWEDFSFAPQGDKIAAKSIALSPENRWLISSDPIGKNIELIEPMGENADKVIVDWSPSRQIVALSLTGEPLGADRQELLFVGLHGENFPSTVVEGRGLQTKWSPTGSKLLYNVYSARSEFKPELWVVNAQGDNIGSGRRLLNANTWAEKCAFADNRFIYCGVPTKLDVGVGFAPELSNYTPDKIYKIDTETGLKTELKSDQLYVVNNMFLSEDKKTLYLTDKNASGLFSIKL